MSSEVKKVPYFKFYCHRAWCVGPYSYQVGVLWKPTDNPNPGDMLWQKEFGIRWTWNIKTIRR